MANTSSKINHYAIILCGGTGPRLWPQSRASHPKQFLSIFSPDSLLQETIKRAQKVVPKNHVFIVTNQRYATQIEAQTKKLIPSKNIISEPLKKNTALAILLAVAKIESLDPKPFILTSFPADHHIEKLPRFISDIKKMAKIALEHGKIVTLGIKPTSPNPAYGYITTKKTQSNFHVVKSFVEKPSVPDAQKLIKGSAYWNSGIYTFSSETILSEFAHYQKNYYALYQQLFDNITSESKIKRIYQLSESLAIDKAISEKSQKMALIPASFSWSDIGQWQSVHLKLPKDKDKNSQLGKDTTFIPINSKNCLVSSTKNKIIGLVDVQNLAIIDTPDGLLICQNDADSAYKVRDLIAKMVQSKKTENYFLKTQSENEK